MTAEEAEKKSPKKVLFGKSPKKEEEKKDGSDADSVASTGEDQKSKKNWLGKEVKRPRAEYQAEIDELKLKLAGVEAELESKTAELKAFKDWLDKAPAGPLKVEVQIQESSV